MNSPAFKYLALILVLGTMLLGLPAAAQEIDLPETFTFDSGTTFNFPEGGEVEVDEDNPNFMSVMFDDSGFYVADFSIFEARDFTADSELIDVAEWYIENISGMAFHADDVEAIELDGREVLKYAYVYEDNDWLFVLVRFEDGTFAGIDAGGTDEDTLLAVASTLGVTEVETTSDGASCTVSAAADGTVQLRVGPGENRTSYAFLPADSEFTPLGQAEAGDGSLWFQLDKAEVAPQSAAAEAWVAADAVDTTGDCENIGESSAPPIVPIVPVAPPANTDSGSGDSGGGQTGSTGGSIVPSDGMWTISYASQGKGSCLDDSGFTYEFGVDWGSDVVSLSFNGSSMILGGNRFTQIQPGVFSGVFTLSNGNALQLILRPVSPTHFTGDAMLTGVVEGHTCSNTVPVTVTKN